MRKKAVELLARAKATHARADRVHRAVERSHQRADKLHQDVRNTGRRPAR